MDLQYFEDTDGKAVAVNTANVTSVTGSRASHTDIASRASHTAITDIKFVGGEVIRVKASYENVVARLTGNPELAPR